VQVSVKADERNTLLVEDHLGEDQALLASKNCCVESLVMEAFGTVGHLACLRKRCGAYLDTARSFADAFLMPDFLGAPEELEDEGVQPLVVVVLGPCHQKEPSSYRDQTYLGSIDSSY